MTTFPARALAAWIAMLAVAGFACTSESKTESKTTAAAAAVPVAEGEPGLAPTKFAVVWSWVNADKALIDAHVAHQSLQLRNLAAQGTAESVYFDTTPTGDDAIGYPTIGFILNAKSEAAARELLDQMVFVEKRIADYTLHPVGNKWLGAPPAGGPPGTAPDRYVTVWTTTPGPDVQPRIDELAPTQTEEVLELWRSGTIENVYFDAVGVYQDNDTVDFVYFVRAKSESDARSVADGLPFTKAGLATYEIHEVGVPLY